MIMRQIYVGILVTAVSWLAVASHVARAQDGAEGDWIGPYGAATIGYGQTDLDIVENGGSPVSGGLEDATYGLIGGINLPLGPRGLIGAEADFAWTNADGRIDGDVYGIDNMASLRARIGYFLLPNTLVFVTGGAAYAQFLYAGEVTPPPPPAVVAPPPTFIDDWVWGYLLGLGFEQRLLGNLNLRFEYFYSDFPTWEFVSGPDGYDVESDTHTIRIGVVVPINAP